MNCHTQCPITGIETPGYLTTLPFSSTSRLSAETGLCKTRMASPTNPILWKAIYMQERKYRTVPTSRNPNTFEHPTEDQLELGYNPSVAAHNPSPTAPNTGFLPLDWLSDPKTEKSLADRIMARLFHAEAREPDVWFRDDYRQAFITVSLAAKGNTMPFVVASYQMYGVHPDKLWDAICQRRKALLGAPTPITSAQTTEPAGANPPSPVKPAPAPVLSFVKKEGAA